MSALTAIVVILVAPVLIHVVLTRVLREADRRAGVPHDVAWSAPVQPPVPGSSPGGGGTYLEVGAWSGRTYPRGAVVVGYDGKDHSRGAVEWASLEAARREEPLVVLYAADYPGMTGPPGPGLHYREPGALEAAEEVTAAGVAEARAAVPGLDVVGATEVTGPGRALAAASLDASLVVVGSRGRPRWVGALRRSVGCDVAGRAHAPVVVVRSPRRAGRRPAGGSGRCTDRALASDDRAGVAGGERPVEG